MSVWPAWEVREGERCTRWLHVRLAFRDGATVEALASVGEGWVCLEDVQARPALALEDLAVFADWIEGPLARPAAPSPSRNRSRGRAPAARIRGGAAGRAGRVAGRGPGVPGRAGAGRRPGARGDGPDRLQPARALRLIGRTRDAGLLSPRHARRRTDHL